MAAVSFHTRCPHATEVCTTVEAAATRAPASPRNAREHRDQSPPADATSGPVRGGTGRDSTM